MLIMIFSVFLSFQTQADCGSTLQTIWKINQKNKSMKLMGKSSHADSFCSPVPTPALNSRVSLFNKSKQAIFSQPVYFQNRTYFDTRQNHGFFDPVEVSVQIKFPKLMALQDAQLIELRDPEGKLIARGSW